MNVDGSGNLKPQSLRIDRNSMGNPEFVSEFITNLTTKIGNVSIRFDRINVAINDGYLRFKLFN